MKKGFREEYKVNYAISERQDRITDATTLTRMVGCNEMYCAATVLCFTGLYWNMLGCTGQYWTVLSCRGSSELYWDVLGCSGLYWAALGCTWLYWAVLGYTGLH